MFEFQQGGVLMEKYLPLLQSSPLFTHIASSEIIAMLHCLGATITTKPKDSYILTTGDTTNYIGFILTGSVLICQEDILGHRNIITNALPGDTFAEAYAAVPKIPLNVSVVAKENCSFLKLDMQRVLATCPTHCKQHGQMINNLVTVLARKNIVMNEKITHTSKRSTRNKILSYLSAQVQKNNSLTFTIPFDRQQLADYLCVERSAMSVELSKLQSEGLLTTNRNVFTLNFKS